MLVQLKYPNSELRILNTQRYSVIKGKQPTISVLFIDIPNFSCAMEMGLHDPAPYCGVYSHHTPQFTLPVLVNIMKSLLSMEKFQRYTTIISQHALINLPAHQSE